MASTVEKQLHEPIMTEFTDTYVRHQALTH